MPSEKIDPEVKETLMKVKEINQNREKALKRIEELNGFEREIGLPNAESEKFVTQAKININKVNNALKNRGL
jgi:hypothetical protein